jgi:hypothetical protein
MRIGSMGSTPHGFSKARNPPTFRCTSRPNSRW